MVEASWGSPQVCKSKRLRRTPGDGEGHHGCKSPAECDMQAAGSFGVGAGFDSGLCLTKSPDDDSTVQYSVRSSAPV
jgi:hypothetical protein